MSTPEFLEKIQALPARLQDKVEDFCGFSVDTSIGGPGGGAPRPPQDSRFVPCPAQVTSNRVTEGWVQPRGLYFFGACDPK